MAVKSFVLLDVDAGVSTGDVSIRPADVPGGANGYSITKRTLRGGLSDGVDVIRVDNGAFSFDLLPTRGMGIHKAWLGKTEAANEIGWRSPVRGPVHPQFVDVGEPSGLGWLDGFDELLVRCGLESNGAPEFDADTGRLKYPLHGRIANKPARFVKVDVDGDTGEITVTGVVEEARFHFLKLRLTTTIKTKVGELGFRLHDEVENISGSPAESQMLYHINFGEPLLDAGSRFVAPVKTLVPRNARAAEGLASWDSYAAPQPGFVEQVYFMELLADAQGQTRTLLKNAHGTRGVSLHFDKRQLPYFIVWKNTTSSPDGYVTGLEPSTNFPNPRSFEGEHGRVVKLAPGAKTAFDLRLEVHGTAAQVDAAEKAVAALKGSSKPSIHNQPQPDWCAP